MAGLWFRLKISMFFERIMRFLDGPTEVGCKLKCQLAPRSILGWYFFALVYDDEIEGIFGANKLQA